MAEEDTRALEMDLLMSMFSDDFKMQDGDDFACTVDLRPMGIDGPSLFLTVSLPDGYPLQQPPSLRLSLDHLSRQGADALNRGMDEVVAEQAGEMCMMSVVSYLQDSAIEHLQEALATAAAASTAPKAKKQLERSNVRQGTKCSMWEEFCLLSDAGAEWSVCHCIPKDLDFSAGGGHELATLKKQFGGLDELRSQKLQLGALGVLHKKGRFIYYLVTKVNQGPKTKTVSLEAALTAMKERVVQDGVQQLAMAMIGGRSEGVPWENVQDFIMKLFDEVPIEILVCAELPS